MGSKIVTAKNMNEIVQNHSIIFLDFWASWCEPCKVFGPIFNRVAEKNPDIFFGTINTESEHELSAEFNVRSIPTLVILKDQTIIYAEAGSKPEYLLSQMVDDVRKLDVATLEQE